MDGFDVRQLLTEEEIEALEDEQQEAREIIEEADVFEATPKYNIDDFPAYNDIIRLSPYDLIEFLESGIKFTLTPIDNPLAAEEAMSTLGLISQRVDYLESLCNRVRVIKRQLARTGGKRNNEAYDDMIDNENSIQATLSSLDKTYKTISKAVSLFQCELSRGVA